MDIKLPADVQKIINKFTEANYQIYIVGGAVRDLILEKEVNDWDFTTDAKPEEILKLFPKGFYDNKFGTVGVPVNTKIFEITTMRKEDNYSDHRHPLKISWTNKIEKDLARRDFTVNSIALTLDSRNLTLIDPFNGQADITAKLIRSVGNPTKRFQEDALRLMRAIRIATQLDYEIEDTTFAAILKNANLIKDIAWERIRDELFKILSSQNPYQGILKLREAGLLQIILPELEACFGIIQEGPNHARVYEIGDHSLRTLRETPTQDPTVKLAALLHDVGKTQTYKKDAEGNVTFYNHEIVGANIVKKIAKRFNLSKKQADKIYKLVRWHMFAVNENQTDSAIRRLIKNVGLETMDDLMALRIGDRLGGDTRKPVSWRMEKFQERIKQVLEKPFTIQDLKINGHDVMEVLKIKPGREVGEILNKLFAETQADSSKNTRKNLLSKLQTLAS